MRDQGIRRFAGTLYSPPMDCFPQSVPLEHFANVWFILFRRNILWVEEMAKFIDVSSEHIVGRRYDEIYERSIGTFCGWKRWRNLLMFHRNILWVEDMTKFMNVPSERFVGGRDSEIC